MNKKSPGGVTDSRTILHDLRVALNKLRTDTDIIIREADKGGNIVIMDKQDYDAEIMGQLLDSNCYIPIYQNPMGPLTTLINRHIEDWHSLGLLYDD